MHTFCLNYFFIIEIILQHCYSAASFNKSYIKSTWLHYSLRLHNIYSTNKFSFYFKCWSPTWRLKWCTLWSLWVKEEVSWGWHIYRIIGSGELGLVRRLTGKDWKTRVQEVWVAELHEHMLRISSYHTLLPTRDGHHGRCSQNDQRA